MKFSAFLKRGVGRIGSQRLHRVLLVFYTEFRFLPSSPLTNSSAPMTPTHLKCFLFLQVPSQCPDYSLLQARNPVSQLGLGLRGRRHQMSVLCSAPWWTYPWSETIPLTSPGWGCQLQNTSLSIYSGPWVSLGSAWSTLNAAEKGVIDILKASVKPPVHGCDSCNVTWFSMIPELEKIRQLIRLLLRFQQHRLINSSSAHLEQPSMLPSINLLWPMAGKPHPLQATLGSHLGSTTETNFSLCPTRGDMVASKFPFQREKKCNIHGIFKFLLSLSFLQMNYIGCTGNLLLHTEKEPV